jgi:prepilin-type N-terminal cleavage/methylation domain-containing protein
VIFFIPTPRILIGISHEPISSAKQKFKIKNLRVSASRNCGEKLNIQNPSVAPLTPSSLNPLPPFRPLRPLRAKARPGNAGREPSAFTLVELLAVVGIMGLLAAVAVPALKGLTGSGGRKQALSQVMGALEIARNTAISTGTNAAVIFPDSTTDSTFGGLQNPYRYRSMAVVAWNATNASTPATMVGSWIVLPQGIALFPNSISALPQATNISVRILTSNNTASYRAIVFQSDGGLSEDFTSIPTNGIAFFEGTVTEQTKVNTNSLTSKYEAVRLRKYTGRAFATLVPTP